MVITITMMMTMSFLHRYVPTHLSSPIANFKIVQTPSLATISSLLDSPSFDILGSDDDDDEKKKRRREIFRKIVGYVLKYHGLMDAYTAKDLAGNNTFETALETKDGAFGGLNQRVRVEKSVLPPCTCLLLITSWTDTDNSA
jgi:hypothetical protein